MLDDSRYPLEDRLYATLLLNSTAELSLTSGANKAVTFEAGPGVVSFDVPRLPGQQRVKVTRGGVILVDVVGSELVNISTSSYVLARCDHQTFTGTALLGLNH